MVKARLKAVIASTLYYSGVLHLWKAIALRDKAIVLMYHRVLTEDERARSASHPAVVIDRDTFAAQMAFLKRHFVVLSLDEFADRLARREPFPSGSVLITFDDGWHDNFTNALPILQHHNLPALIFLPRNYIGGRRLFWQEALTHLLLRVIAEVRRDPKQRAKFAALLGDDDLAALMDLPDADPRRQVLVAIGKQKRLPRETITRLIERLADGLGMPPERLSDVDGFIDWDQVHEMSRAGISFGGHGVDHLLLTQVSATEADSEIHGAKAMIDSRLKGTVPTFSFPNGYWTPDLVESVKRAGYRLAFLTKPGFVSCHDDPFTVKRLNVHQGGTRTMPLFLSRVLGLL